MAYILQTPTHGTIHPDTLGEALVQYLDAEFPLLDGTRLADKFFAFVEREGLDADALRAMAFRRPSGAKNFDF